MLRRTLPASKGGAPEPEGFVAYPSPKKPFILGHGPSGIHFYQAKGAFHLPYSALEAMRLSEETLTLVFTADEIVITGRGLHSVYAQIASQRVTRIHEQGRRYEEENEHPIFIAGIERRPRNTKLPHDLPLSVE